MKYLIETTEVYRVDNEDEVVSLIEDAKRTSTVKKHTSVQRQKKLKGEVIDQWYKVSITKVWDDEKEPGNGIAVSYGTDSAF